MKKEKQKEKEGGTGFKQIWLSLKEFYAPFYGVIFVIFGLTLLQEVLALVAPFIYGKIIDGVIANQAIQVVINLALLFFITHILSEVIIGYIRMRIETERFDSDFSDLIFKKSLSKVFKFSIGQHEGQNSGVKKSIIDRGQSALPIFTSDVLYQVMPLFLQVTITIGALFFIAPILGAILFAGVFIFVIIIFLINNSLGDKLREAQEMRNETDKRQAEFLRNASLIKINAKEEDIFKEYEKDLSGVTALIKKTWLKFLHYFSLRNSVVEITRVAVMIVGIYLVYKKIYTPGFLIIFLSWSSNAFNRLWSLSYLQRNIINNWSAIRNLLALLDTEPAIKEIENPIILDKIKGNIYYENVWFKYPSREMPDEITKNIKKIKENQEYTLRSINISIKAGERVAIVGHSGAGKSSLVQLLVRAYDPNKGKILIDGQNLSDLSLENYRSSLGVVPQDVSLFDNTLRYNILFGAKGKVSEKQLDEAVRMSRVDIFIKNLENGLNTMIGEKGIKLSGGERQRVGIARALVKNPSILIFDEATSSLDVENEALIRESINTASKGRTTIIIAHRLSTIKDADKIIVLEKGKVIGEGKHASLLKTCEPYKKMINIQTVIVGSN